MNVPVVLYGSPILRENAYKVTEEDVSGQFAVNLRDTLKNAKGLGLAGPQIGILKRIFVIDTTPLAGNGNPVEKYEQVFINPEIIWRSSEINFYNEGCLSFPGIYEEVFRPEKIRVRYNDLAFDIFEEEFSGIKARIFQHEYDHLDGILFIDKIDLLERTLLSGKLKRIAKLSKL